MNLQKEPTAAELHRKISEGTLEDTALSRTELEALLDYEISCLTKDPAYPTTLLDRCFELLSGYPEYARIAEKINMPSLVSTATAQHNRGVETQKLHRRMPWKKVGLVAAVCALTAAVLLTVLLPYIAEPDESPVSATESSDVATASEPVSEPRTAFRDYEYTVLSGGATITHYDGAESSIAIPSMIEGIPVTAIGEKAFRGNTMLNDVTIPEGVITIGADAFASCTSLCSVTFPSSLQSIDETAFVDCFSLEKIGVPGDSFAMQWCKDNDYKYILRVDEISESFRFTVEGEGEDAKVIFNGYDGDETVLTIPETINNLPVVSISAYAFADNTTLCSVMIPNSVTVLGEGAFANCVNLQSVALPATLQRIGAQMFAGCSALQSITLPAALDSIGSGAFSGCTGLVYAGIPDMLKSIGKEAYAGCTSLKEIEFPGTLSVLGERAFAGCVSLTAIELPDSLVELGDGAFSGCTAASALRLPSYLTAIGNDAFASCASLTGVAFPSSVVSVGKSAFSDCTSLAAVSLNERLATMGVGVFENCTALESLAFPKALKIIPPKALKNAAALTSMSFGSNVNEISAEAFAGCLSLKNAILPAGLKKIGASAFSGCASLQSVILPNGIVSLGDRAYQNCKALQTITIPTSLTAFGADVFADDAALKTISVENGSYAIVWCKNAGHGNLLSISGETQEDVFLRSVNNRTFIYDEYTSYIRITGCVSSAADIVVPAFLNGKPVIEIGYAAFSGDGLRGLSTLRSVTVQEGIEIIAEEAFASCASLQSVTLPSTVKTIGSGAFEKCTSLASVRLPSGLSVLPERIFYGCTMLTAIELPSGVTGIGSDAFAASGLIALRIPSSVQTIGDGAFAASKLNTVTIPKTVSEVGKRLFENCLSLTAVQFNARCGILPERTFYGCTALRSVRISTGIAAIGQEAFAKASLYSLELPSTLQSVSANAFEEPQSLGTVTITHSDFTTILWEKETLENISDALIINGTTYLELYGPKEEPLYLWEESQEGIVITGVNPKLLNGDTLTVPDVLDGKPVVALADGAFRALPVVSVVLPEGLLSIGKDVFEGTPITVLMLPSTLTVIAEEAFDGIKAEISAPAGSFAENWLTLHHAEIPFTWLENEDGTVTLTSYFGNDTQLLIPAEINGLSVTALGEAFLAGNITVVTVEVPEGVRFIGKGAFDSCRSMTAVSLPSTLDELGTGAFKNCVSITKIQLPESLQAVSDMTFFGCFSLKDLTLPETLRSIGAYSFANTGVTELTLPSMLENIGAYAFAFSDIEQITLGNQVQSVAEYAFFACTRLTGVDLGISVKEIGSFAFYGCSALTEIVLPESLTELGENCFENCPLLSEIIVPDGAVRDKLLKTDLKELLDERTEN